MNSNIFAFLVVALALFMNVQSLPCSNKNSTRVKREGPDLIGIGMQVAATAMEMAQSGGGMKNNFNIQHGNENIFRHFKLNANKFNQHHFL